VEWFYTALTMTIHKCDKCNKVLKREPIEIRVGFFYVELCPNCSKKFVKVLYEEELLQEALAKFGYS
jgi:NAD-dependent SIR2 family protein deacetylase